MITNDNIIFKYELTDFGGLLCFTSCYYFFFYSSLEIIKLNTYLRRKQFNLTNKILETII